MTHVRLLAGAALFSAAALSASALAQVQVIFTEIPASPTSTAPGTLDLAGLPAATRWKALEDMAVKPDGSEWVLKARNELGSDLENTIVRGMGASGTMFMQEGQPFAGGVPGELYDFFDTGTPVSWNSLNQIGFSARARGNVTGVLEKVVVYDVGTSAHTIVLQQSAPLVGCQDLLPNPSGDETLGNSVASVCLLDSGLMAFGVTPINNSHSSRYPGHFRGNTMYRQSGVSLVGVSDTWKSISYDKASTTPDGLHWLAQGTRVTTDTTTDTILALDDQIVLQEGFPVPGAGFNLGDIFANQLTAGGRWAARGRDNSGTTAAAPDWAVRDGVLLAKTGDSVEGGAEAWGDTFLTVAINDAGDWALAGNTNNADPAIDSVIAVNGRVVLREGDPVDVDGNGSFDDDAFIGRGTNTLGAFKAGGLALTENGWLYAIVYLRNAAGQDLNSVPAFGTPDAFVRLRLGTPPLPFCFGDGSGTPCPCGNAGLPGNGCANSVNANGGNLAATGSSSLSADSVVLVGSGMPSSSALYFQGTTQTAGGAGAVFGDGLRCAAGAIVRLKTLVNSGGASQYPGGGDPSVSVRGLIGAPGTRTYQIWYRNAAAYCTVQTFNLTNGVQLTWIP